MTTTSNFRSTLAAVPLLSRTSLVLMTASSVVRHLVLERLPVYCALNSVAGEWQFEWAQSCFLPDISTITGNPETIEVTTGCQKARQLKIRFRNMVSRRARSLASVIPKEACDSLIKPL